MRPRATSGADARRRASRVGVRRGRDHECGEQRRAVRTRRGRATGRPGGPCTTRRSSTRARRTRRHWSAKAGDRLTLELTEGAIIQDPERVAQALKSPQRFDVKIAMDDSAPATPRSPSLQLLQIDILKIDQRSSPACSKTATAPPLSTPSCRSPARSAWRRRPRGSRRRRWRRPCSKGLHLRPGLSYAEALPADAALAYWLDRNA